MNIFRAAVLAALGAAMVFAPQAAQSESVLWDLIIQTDVGGGQIPRGQTPVVEGRVADHAGRPVAGAAVVVTSGVLVFDARTDGSGAFRQAIAGFDGLPGSYVVNVKAVAGDRLGMTSLSFQVTGEVYESEVLYKQIAGKTAQAYINSSEEDYAADPIGAKMYRHYQEAYSKYLEALEAEGRIRDTAAEEAARKERAGVLLQQEIEEMRPGGGVYEGRGYRVFVHGLDDGVRDTITSQINHTRAAFDDARQLMRSMLEAGHSYEEARAAYIDRLSITKEEMERVGVRNTQGPPVQDGAEPAAAAAAAGNATGAAAAGNATGAAAATPGSAAEAQRQMYQIAPNATAAAQAPVVHATGRAPTVVVPDGGSVFIEVGGVLQEFILNGTQLVQVAGPAR